MLFAAVVSLVVDVFQMIDPARQLQVVGRPLLIVIAGLAALYVLVSVYRGLLAKCWRNELRVFAARRLLREFQLAHDGVALTASVSVKEVRLIDRCLKARPLRFRVRRVQVLPPPPGATAPRLEFQIDKGLDDRLCPGMTFEVYKRDRQGALCQVPIRDEAEQVVAGAASGTLASQTAFLVVPVDPAWQLDLSGVRADSFANARLLEPRAPSPINQLLATLIYELERDWTLRDPRR